VNKTDEGPGTEYDGNEYGWLEGAEFTLTKIQDHTINAQGDSVFTDCEHVEMKFDATTHILSAGGTNPTSDARGYIPMKGLDAGTYELKEVRAPLGFAFNPNITYTIKITPTYVLEPVPSTVGNIAEDGKGGADDLILESYKVEITTQELDKNLNIIENQSVSTISIFNMKKIDLNNDNTGDTPASLLKDDGTSNVDDSNGQNATGGIDVSVDSFGTNTTAMVYNKKLGILPATGGSGILFYLFVGGGIAAIALVLMRKTKKAATAA
jgi:LPXTG-motif cell wall-anchored protein